jgi:hypothetical protein
MGLSPCLFLELNRQNLGRETHSRPFRLVTPGSIRRDRWLLFSGLKRPRDEQKQHNPNGTVLVDESEGGLHNSAYAIREIQHSLVRIISRSRYSLRILKAGEAQMSQAPQLLL